jgi:spore coat polysaccharide biosynthesis protein SpsF (cytidylyltransferase family)
MPAIIFMMRRLAHARLVDLAAVVTSVDQTDDALVEVLSQHGVRCHRGPLYDVLDRYRQAAEAYGATEVVRLTGDCPLLDPHLVDAVIRLRRDAGSAYASNIDPPTYPDGLDVECFTRAALEEAARTAKLLQDREHVTLWMRERAPHLARVNLRGAIDASNLRLTVDYPDDLDVVRRITERLQRPLEADWYDILRVLDADFDLRGSNPHRRNEALDCPSPAHNLLAP